MSQRKWISLEPLNLDSHSGSLAYSSFKGSHLLWLAILKSPIPYNLEVLPAV